MKTDLFLPVINRADFDSFARLMKGALPATYEAWRERHGEHIADNAGDYQIIEIEVNSDDFIAFADEHGKAHDFHTLLTFAKYLGARKG
jgi:hypothetical protein